MTNIEQHPLDTAQWSTPGAGGGDACIVTRTLPDRPRSLIDMADLLALGALAVGTPIASILSDKQLGALASNLTRFLPPGFRQEAKLDTFVKLGGMSRDEAVTLRDRQLEQRLTSLVFFLKQLGGRPAYKATVEGQENVAEALAHGRGAVIWIADFVFASEITRQAFHSVGHPLTHMIRPEHGLSSTRFGLRYLNPIHARVEMPYLRERIVFDRNDPQKARHRLEQCLAENGLISILACAYEGRKLVYCPFLRGRLALAAGAPALAFKMRCPILPVFALPSPRAPNFVVTIGKPLSMSATDRDTALLQATSDFVQRLAPYVNAYPHLWRGWPSLAGDSVISDTA
ncbi:hypothetical protein [Taklimakanibacter lacteus]|uniref:hypothetical protein n=1 Tax=Taklimakanibacter lacteus TaxID=2268456 RepID=UPI0013C3F463